MKNKNLKWIKFTERECDLFTAYCIMIGYLQYYKDIAGANFNNFLLINKNGIVHSWRLESEYNTFLKKLKNEKPDKFLKLLNNLDKQNKKLLKFLDYNNLQDYSNNELLKIFSNFVGNYSKYFSLFTLPKYFGMILDEKLLSAKIKTKLRKVRGVADYEKIQKKFLPLFFKELQKRFNISWELFFYALPSEIINLLKSSQEINEKELRQRKRLVGFLTRNGQKTKMFLGQAADNILKENIKNGNYKEKTIKGMTANGGIVTGRVKIVLRESDLKNIKNKIIVTPMTSIKFVPYLKGILGIVTNEGGIACHAAIISREMNVPCVVGTKMATAILKNNDKIKLDANKGLITVL